MDKIKIIGLEIFASHGVYPEETVLGQKFVVSAELYLDTRKAGMFDDLDRSVDYGSVCRFMTDFMQNNTFKLIEAAAERLAEAVLLEFPLLHGIHLELRKPWAPVHLPLQTVGIEITREWHRAYIALGANMGNEEAYLKDAVKELQDRKDCSVLKIADFIHTKAYGVTNQKDFLNSVLEMDTLLPPHELLDVLHVIENAAGRKRTLHWGPRTLDLDILLYDQLILDDPDLVIPHKEMHLRDFVLRPLHQIAPTLRHPVLNKTIEELFEDL
ncbi:MAG: 2-amino-4-hydroxy-6-hydroxymethyldihydropteridine diphosphokinase [Blautia sp.]|nr:2-amino-4-hydroxy-6-hydroxymethyldihydropteridine diphosphokinase [Blautia sp.]